VRRFADARRRAASEMEGERHMLERDLHDGVQLHLVSAQLACALVEQRLEDGVVDQKALEQAIADLGRRLRRTHRLLLDTAAGVQPNPLRTAGLARALTISLRDAHGVALRVDPITAARRYPSAVESAVYFCCLEAVSNARKHAAGAAVTVILLGTSRGLWFSVSDTGPGPGRAAETGLGALRARLASVGGTLRVGQAPDGGTTLVGDVPV
jgi:signal transduction histidine kinase